MSVTFAVQHLNKMLTKGRYVLVSSRGTKVCEFDTPESAREWQRKQKEKHGDKAPNLILVKYVTTVHEVSDDE